MNYPVPYQPQQPRISWIEDPFPGWAIALHILLTLGTCGCWSPIWLIHYIAHPKYKKVVHY